MARCGLDVDFRRAGDTGVLALIGDLDIATCAVLADRFGSIPPLPVVVVDLDGLLFCGVRGLETLLRGTEDAHRRGSRVVLARRPATVRRLMDLLGIDSRPHPLTADPADRDAVELVARTAGPDPTLR